MPHRNEPISKNRGWPSFRAHNYFAIAVSLITATFTDDLLHISDFMEDSSRLRSRDPTIRKHASIRLKSSVSRRIIAENYTFRVTLPRKSVT